MTFHNRSSVFLDPGEYKFTYKIDSLSYEESILITDQNSLIVLNLLKYPLKLDQVNMNDTIYLSPDRAIKYLDHRRPRYIKF